MPRGAANPPLGKPIRPPRKRQDVCGELWKSSRSAPRVSSCRGRIFPATAAIQVLSAMRSSPCVRDRRRSRPRRWVRTRGEAFPQRCRPEMDQRGTRTRTRNSSSAGTRVRGRGGEHELGTGSPSMISGKSRVAGRLGRQTLASASRMRHAINDRRSAVLLPLQTLCQQVPVGGDADCAEERIGTHRTAHQRCQVLRPCGSPPASSPPWRARCQSGRSRAPFNA